MKSKILSLCLSAVMLMFASAAFAQTSSCSKKAKADCPVTKCCKKADCTDPANCPMMTTEATTASMNSTSENAAKDAKATKKDCKMKCTKPAATETLAKASKTTEASVASTAKKD
jgi:hypothetical protein